SLALGALSGEIIDIDKRLNALGRWLQNRTQRTQPQINTDDTVNESSFNKGFVSATLLFCVGAMSIIGSIESGLGGDRSIIFTKSILDGVSSMMLASCFGVGVMFSVVVILVYQGSIELFAATLQNLLTDELVVQVSAAGSVMILAIGLNMVLDSRIKTANLLPGLVFAVGYFCLFLM
ncbi:MAG: DUF554 domain-containing protein, partial [Oscillospiraceae bacterium]|nr:DUF554 domain-containing protein [Oscillospiraceae bacterium]